LLLNLLDDTTEAEVAHQDENNLDEASGMNATT
jgi:hypothetical protein